MQCLSTPHHTCVVWCRNTHVCGVHGRTPSEESEADGGRQEREKRSLPYWDLWSSDFFGWLEELRAQAAHDGMQDLARTFWAHFPIGNELGYDSPESDPQLQE
uniref:Uncharacterized protein n=1 Tax=Seriola dumerili TaxID=41447 RepID=A0A3B4TS76_SERDU